MATAFFPLDNELKLLAKKQYTPRIQQSMARLGAKLPFRQATEEVLWSHQVSVGVSTLREATHEMGRAVVALESMAGDASEAEQIEEKQIEEVLQLSADGCFIQTTGGEWKEVKTMAIGSVKNEQGQTKTNDWSYFSRCDNVRDFEDAAMGEVQKRGLTRVETVVAVNDGAAWLQAFTEYHRPDAVRVLDFAHAAAYLATAGKAVLGETSNQFKNWYHDACQRLRTEPPDQTIARLYLLGRKATSDTDATTIYASIDYLERRIEQIDYRFFISQHYPIGSGSVESAHKHVVQQRMKLAGMRWAEHNINPLLSLRNLVANDRWSTGWSGSLSHRLTQQHQRYLPMPTQVMTPPVTLDSVRVLADSPIIEIAPKEHKPAQNHPWRRGIWPDPR